MNFIIKSFLWTCFVVFLLISISCSRQKPNTELIKPNIIFIMFDDLDFDELNIYDSEKFPCYWNMHSKKYPNTEYGGVMKVNKFIMPNIDKFASKSVIFNHFYAPASTCTPVRYTVLTGRSPTNNSFYRKCFKKGDNPSVSWNSMIFPGDTTVVNWMHDRGYKTGIVGKWHNGANGKNILFPITPDYFEDSSKVKRIEDDYNYFIKYLQDTIGFDYASKIHYDNPCFQNLEWISEGALEFIDKYEKDPFYLYLPIPLPHAQYSAFSDFDPLMTPMGKLDKAPNGHISIAHARELNQNAKMPENVAMATWFDDFFGALVQSLKDKGLYDNTIIIITSDQQTRGKFTCYESCRIPFILGCPNLTHKKFEIDELCVLTDVVPTLLNIIDGNELHNNFFDGMSFLPLLEKRKIPWRKELLLESNHCKAIVTKDWKYIACRPPDDVKMKMENDLQRSLKENTRRNVGWDGYEGWGHKGVVFNADKDFPYYFDPDQLYNLNEDILEQHNLVNDESNQIVLEELKELLKKHLKNYPYSFGEFTSN